MLDEQHCADEAARIYRHLRKYGNAYTVAVFVTPDGVFFAEQSSRRSYARLITRYAHCVIGYYNRRVDPLVLRQDIVDAAEEAGLA